MQRITLGIAAAFLALSAHAAEPINTEEYYQIGQLYPATNGYYFWLETGNTNITPLENSNWCKNRMFIGLDHPNYQALVATAMYADSKEIPVRPYYIDEGITCGASLQRLLTKY